MDLSNNEKASSKQSLGSNEFNAEFCKNVREDLLQICIERGYSQSHFRKHYPGFKTRQGLS